MSSTEFLETLRCIGCPGVENLRPESVDWMFENSSSQQFLSWFSSSTTNENVIDAHSLAEYQGLEERGETLDVEDLDNAFGATIQSKSLTEEQLQAQVDELKAAISKSQARKNVLMKRCNKVSVQHMDLKNRVGKMQTVQSHWVRENMQTQEQSKSENTQLGVSLEELSQSVISLMQLYNLQHKGSSKADKTPVTEKDRNFLSQLDLQQFHEAEAKYSKEVTAFTKKQFFVGMADLAGEREDTEYNILDISSPGGHQLSEDGQDTFYEDCQEFSRLQKIFPQSECARINALINAKKASSAVHEARAILHQLKSDAFPKEPNEISRHRHVAEQKAAESKAETTPLLSSLPDLIQELGSLQGTEILTGDYNLKLKRQDYFMKSQEKIIDYLVKQRARSEFVSMLYDLELKWHKETHGLISAARAALEKHLSDWQARMAELDEPDLSEKKFERNVVDTRDTATARLFQLMDDGKEDEKQIYLPVQKVIAKAEELTTKQSEAASNDRARDESDLNKVHQLNTCVAECEAVLYEDTHAGLPNLTPTRVQGAMTEVAGQLSSLEAKILEVLAQVNSKKTELQRDILQKKERELYVLFHTNPEKLKYVVNGLAERQKAREVQD